MKIAIDHDGVKADFVRSYLIFHNRVFGTNFKYEEVKSYELWKLWGGTREDSIPIFRRYWSSPEFANTKTIHGSREGIERIGQRHKLIGITARPLELKDQTLYWLDKHFPNKFEEYFFTEEWASHSEKGNPKKAQVCQLEKVQVLIEDSIEMARGCAEVCQEVYLLNRPWNLNQDSLPKNVIRVNSWRQLSEYLK